MKSQKVFALFLAGIFALFVFSQVATADVEKTINKSFQVHEGGTLTVESDLGSIKVSSAPGDEVRIELIQKVETSSERKAERILRDLDVRFEKRGDDVTVIAEYERNEGFFNWGRNPLKLEYIISVPSVYNVALKTSGGSISVDDLEGTVNAHTSGGSLSFGNINGPVDGKTSGGSISLDGCDGPALVRTSGGSITLGDVNGDVDARTSGGSINITQAKGSVVAKTSGGSINVKEVMGNIDASTSGGSVTAHLTTQPTNDCRLTTSGGSVNVYMTEDVKVNLDAKTSGGKVRTDFPVTIQGDIHPSSLQAEVNGGGPELYLRTSGGNIHLYRL
ncbi:hypothetical protein A2V82_04880 [candidate division KSB1 bacterium RBG_16_48_16]|nr:MAG: hypothetical protein A2V82_04880 [candidate division KSB1 bacterium RBG_16_48_16]